jgi:hypothetical protein
LRYSGALGTVAIVAGVVRRPLKAALQTDVYVATKRRCPAALDVVEHGALGGTENVVFFVGLPVLAHDERKLQARPVTLRGLS